MPDQSNNRVKITLGSLEWGVIVSLLISAGSAIFSAGVVYSEVRDHDKRLTKVEVASDDVAERLGRIETNLEYLVARYRRDEERRKD